MMVQYFESNDPISDSVMMGNYSLIKSICSQGLEDNESDTWKSQCESETFVISMFYYIVPVGFPP